MLKNFKLRNIHFFWPSTSLVDCHSIRVPSTYYYKKYKNGQQTRNPNEWMYAVNKV